MKCLSLHISLKYRKNNNNIYHVIPYSEAYEITWPDKYFKRADLGPHSIVNSTVVHYCDHESIFDFSETQLRSKSTGRLLGKTEALILNPFLLLCLNVLLSALTNSRHCAAVKDTMTFPNLH